MPTTSEAVDSIAAVMAEVESLADQIKVKMETLPALFSAINANGDVGVLLSKSLSLRAKAIGLDLKTAVWTFHSDMTEAAKARGIDLPSIEGGGGR